MKYSSLFALFEGNAEFAVHLQLDKTQPVLVADDKGNVSETSHHFYSDRSNGLNQFWSKNPDGSLLLQYLDWKA